MRVKRIPLSSMYQQTAFHCAVCGVDLFDDYETFLQIGKARVQVPETD